MLLDTHTDANTQRTTNSFWTFSLTRFFPDSTQNPGHFQVSEISVHGEQTFLKYANWTSSTAAWASSMSIVFDKRHLAWAVDSRIIVSSERAVTGWVWNNQNNHVYSNQFTTKLNCILTRQLCKGRYICIAPCCRQHTSKALRYGNALSSNLTVLPAHPRVYPRT